MEISPEEEERRELNKEMARQELARLSKPTFLSVSIILIFLGLVIMGVLILFGVIDIGGKHCEQHTIEEAFIACMDSISNSY